MKETGETRSYSAGDKLPEFTGDKLPESTGEVDSTLLGNLLNCTGEVDSTLLGNLLNCTGEVAPLGCLVFRRGTILY